MALLELQDISVHYGRIQALDGITISVEAGEIVSLIGANGAGKTTTMRAISGIRPVSAGKIVFDGEDITKLRADLRVVRGISQSPEGRGVFPGMTVMENLDMGAYARKDRKNIKSDQDRVFSLFPRLAERRTQMGGTMSGGEQQMLAIGRALMARPVLLLLDEPSMGLSPKLVEVIGETLRRLRDNGLSLLLVEQNAMLTFETTTYCLVLENGEVALSDSVADLSRNSRVRSIYIGL